MAADARTERKVQIEKLLRTGKMIISVEEKHHFFN